MITAEDLRKGDWRETSSVGAPGGSRIVYYQVVIEGVTITGFKQTFPDGRRLAGYSVRGERATTLQQAAELASSFIDKGLA